MLRTIIGLMAVVIAVQAIAQNDSTEKPGDKAFRGQDAQRVAAWLQVSRNQAADYQLAKKDQPDQPLKLLPQAVFRHSQPVRGDDIGGIAVHIGARVSALAGPGEVLVSSTVKDLVAGSGITFAARGCAATGTAGSGSAA